jgi:hypothetical protein
MPSTIDNSSAPNVQSMPTPPSLKTGAKHVNSTPVGPAAVSQISHAGYTAVESAQQSAEQSYSAMAAATAGGGHYLTVEFMLEQNGKRL